MVFDKHIQLPSFKDITTNASHLSSELCSSYTLAPGLAALTDFHPLDRRPSYMRQFKGSNLKALNKTLIVYVEIFPYSALSNLAHKLTRISHMQQVTLKDYSDNRAGCYSFCVIIVHICLLVTSTYDFISTISLPRPLQVGEA